MKFSAVVALSLATIVTAQAPGGGMGGKPPGGMGGMGKGPGGMGGMGKGPGAGGMPGGMGGKGMGGMPGGMGGKGMGGMPGGMGGKGMGGMGKGKGGAGGFTPPPGACAFKCVGQMFKDSGCMKDMKPPGMPGMGGMGSAPKSSGALQKRQGASPTSPAQAPMPKFSISPEQIASAKAAKGSADACLCKGPAIKSAMDSCVPTACASGAADGAGTFAKVVNNICKGVEGYSSMSVAPPAPKTDAPAAATAAPAA